VRQGIRRHTSARGERCEPVQHDDEHSPADRNRRGRPSGHTQRLGQDEAAADLGIGREHVGRHGGAQ
jgi:hypothetical protein